MKNTFLRLVKKQNWIVAIVALVMVACLGDPVEQTPVGYVSIYNASAYDGSTLDIYLNDAKINAATFDYTKFSGYLNFNEGSNTLRFNKAGTLTKVMDLTFAVTAEKAYSVFVLNDGNQLSTLQINDVSEPVVANKSRVRFINLSPDSPEIDVIVTGVPATPLFGGRAYKSYSDYVEFDAKSYSFDIINKADGTVLVTVPLVLESLKYYTIVAQGFTGTPPTGNNNKLTLKLLPN